MHFLGKFVPSRLFSKEAVPSLRETKRLFKEHRYKELSTSASDISSEEDILVEKPRRRCVSLGSSVYVVLLAVVFNVVFVVAVWVRVTQETALGTVPGFFPRIEYEEKIFHVEELGPTDKAEQEWDDQMPPGRGFVIIDEPSKFGLPQGIAYADGFNKYGISWAHQYHCLYWLRREFWRLVRNESKLVGASMHDDTDEAEDLVHLAHCFGYLRDHVVCNMDMTLEWPTLKGENEGTINGYEIIHTCKNRRPLDDFVNAHAPDPEIERPPPGHGHHGMNSKTGNSSTVSTA